MAVLGILSAVEDDFHCCDRCSYQRLISSFVSALEHTYPDRFVKLVVWCLTTINYIHMHCIRP